MPYRQTELFKTIRILKMDPPEGETPQTERIVQKGRILKMDSSEGESPQTERIC